jgi:hypothetical protein
MDGRHPWTLLLIGLQQIDAFGKLFYHAAEKLLEHILADFRAS